MEQQHIELSRENRERNAFHGQLPLLISTLHGEKTSAGIIRLLIDFTARALGATEVSLFLVDGSTLVLREARGLPAGKIHVAVGQGRIGAVARVRRIGLFVHEDGRERRRRDTVLGRDSSARMPQPRREQHHSPSDPRGARTQPARLRDRGGAAGAMRCARW